LIAIKVNIIDSLETKMIEYKAFITALDENPEDTALRQVRNRDLVMDDIKNRIFGTKMRSPEKVLKEQKKHLESYLRQTEKANQTMLPALLNPVPLLSQPRPEFTTSGSVAEAAHTLRAAARYFLRHRSAQLAIRKFLYPKQDPNVGLPLYDCQIVRDMLGHCTTVAA
jgi:hypothetical protein